MAKSCKSNKQCRFCLIWCPTSVFQQHEQNCKKKLGVCCMFCSKWFSQKHLEMHQQFCKQKQVKEMAKCKSCKTWCTAGIGLTRHEQFYCKKVEKPQTQIIRKCKFCARSFLQDEVKSHECSCTKNPKNKRKLQKQTILKCQFCTKSFKKKSGLKSHERFCIKSHSEIAKEERCKFCTRAFLKSEVESHELACPKLATKCQYCPKLFKKKSELRSHEDSCIKNNSKMNRPENPTTKCQFCTKTFLKSEVKSHEIACYCGQLWV